MLYICQLGDGKMLALNEENEIGIVTTGIPYADCYINVNGRSIVGQHNVLRAILGYDILDFNDFIVRMLAMDSTPFMKWKLTVQSENIGGGCPLNMQRYARYQLSGLSSLKSFYQLLIPDSFIKEEVNFPSDNWLEENQSYFAYGFSIAEDDDKLLYSGLACVDINFLDILTDALLENSTFSIPRYVTTVEGYRTGVVLFTSSVTDDIDLKYIYCSMYDLNENDFDIKVSVLGSSISISCSAKTEIGRKRLKEEEICDFFGTVQRYIFEDNILDYFKEE